MEAVNEETVRAVDELMGSLGFRATGELTVQPEILDGFLREIVGGPARVTSRVHLAAPTTERTFHVLYTTGMSDLPMPPDEHPRLEHELVMFLPAEWSFGSPASGTPVRGLDGRTLGVVAPAAGVAASRDPRAAWPNLWMHALAQLPHVTGRRLDLGHLVAAGELPGTPFTSFLMTPTFTEDRVTTRDGRPIQLMRVFPLDPEEVRTKRAIGAHAMFQRIEERGAHLHHGPDRPSLADAKPWWRVW